MGDESGFSREDSIVGDVDRLDLCVRDAASPTVAQVIKKEKSKNNLPASDNLKREGFLVRREAVTGKLKKAHTFVWRRRYLVLAGNVDEMVLQCYETRPISDSVAPIQQVVLSKAIVYWYDRNCFQRVKDAFHFGLRSPESTEALVLEADSARERLQWLSTLLACKGLEDGGLIKAPRIFPAALREGWLEKMGKVEKVTGLKGGWKPRYFVAARNPTRLDYYASWEDAEQKRAKGSIPVQPDTAVGPVAGKFLGFDNCLAITPTGPPSRRFVLSCADADDLREWMAVLDQLQNDPNPPTTVFSGNSSSSAASILSSLGTSKSSLASNPVSVAIAQSVAAAFGKSSGENNNNLPNGSPALTSNGSGTSSDNNSGGGGFGSSSAHAAAAQARAEQIKADTERRAQQEMAEQEAARARAEELAKREEEFNAKLQLVGQEKDALRQLEAELEGERLRAYAELEQERAAMLEAIAKEESRVLAERKILDQGRDQHHKESKRVKVMIRLARKEQEQLRREKEELGKKQMAQEVESRKVRELHGLVQQENQSKALLDNDLRKRNMELLEREQRLGDRERERARKDQLLAEFHHVLNEGT